MIIDFIFINKLNDINELSKLKQNFKMINVDLKGKNK